MSYKQKGFLRKVGAAVKAIFKGDFRKGRYRIDVLTRKQKDPFDSYEWLDALHLYCQLRPYYFFLVAERRRIYDKNIPPSNKAMQELILYHSKKRNRRHSPELAKQ